MAGLAQQEHLLRKPAEVRTEIRHPAVVQIQMGEVSVPRASYRSRGSTDEMTERVLAISLYG